MANRGDVGQSIGVASADLPAPRREIVAELGAIVAHQLKDLDVTAERLEKEARGDLRWFWFYKGGAAVLAAGTSGCQYFGWGHVAFVLGLGATFLIGLDALRPRDLLHNARRSAVFDLRLLQKQIDVRWDRLLVRKLDEVKLREGVEDILTTVEDASAVISKQVQRAEAAVGTTPGRKDPPNGEGSQKP
jgi:hypothetical protein